MTFPKVSSQEQEEVEPMTPHTLWTRAEEEELGVRMKSNVP